MKVDLGMVRKITDQFAERLPIIQRSVSSMENTFLDEAKLVDFVDKAAMLRWEKGVITSYSIHYTKLYETIVGVTDNRLNQRVPNIW